MESLFQDSLSFFILTYVPWMKIFLFTENIFLPRLTKQESSRSLHCTSEVFMPCMNTRSIKILRRSVVKVLILLLIKQ